MKNLGIDKDTGDIYIGSRDRGPERAQHVPVFPVRIWGKLLDAISGPEVDSFIVSEYVFQEVSFKARLRMAQNGLAASVLGASSPAGSEVGYFPVSGVSGCFGRW